MLLDIEKAAKLMGFKNGRQFKKVVKKHNIPHIRLNEWNYVFNLEDLKKWIEKNRKN